jgi:hypothetical protein
MDSSLPPILAATTRIEPMPKTTRKAASAAAVEQKTAEIDAMIRRTAKGAKPPAKPAKPPAKRGRKPAAEAKPAKIAGKPGRSAAKQGKAKPAGRTSRKPSPPAVASRKRSGEGQPSVRETIWRLMQRKDGVSEREVCDELGWKKAGATISRAIKAAAFKVRKERIDGKVRYIAV